MYLITWLTLTTLAVFALPLLLARCMRQRPGPEIEATDCLNELFF